MGSNPKAVSNLFQYAKTKWLEAKDELLKGFDFPNLPYYYDPDMDVKLTQTNAILMHIARTNDLCPNTTQGASFFNFR